jgi:two-component system response regulator QseB
MRILLIEDDELVGADIGTGLAQQGYTVDSLKDATHIDHALRIGNFDIMILNVDLPRLSGFNMLENVRSRSQTAPIIILTTRESIEDKIKYLDSGADDYLIKPVNMDELYARLRRLQRRCHAHIELILSHQNVVLNPAAHTVMLNNKIVHISRREFSLLQKLLENVGRVLPRETLTHSLYGWHEDVISNALEVHIYNLRKKFGQDFILTVRGIGYMIDKIDLSSVD